MDDQRVRDVGENVTKKYEAVGCAVGDRAGDERLLAQAEDLATRHAHELGDLHETDRDRRVRQRRSEDHGETDGDDEVRERQQRIGRTPDRGVEPAAVVARDKTDRHGDGDRQQGGEDARLHRGPRAPDDT